VRASAAGAAPAANAAVAARASGVWQIMSGEPREPRRPFQVVTMQSVKEGMLDVSRPLFQCTLSNDAVGCTLSDLPVMMLTGNVYCDLLLPLTVAAQLHLSIDSSKPARNYCDWIGPAIPIAALQPHVDVTLIFRLTRGARGSVTRIESCQAFVIESLYKEALVAASTAVSDTSSDDAATSAAVAATAANGGAGVSATGSRGAVIALPDSSRDIPYIVMGTSAMARFDLLIGTRLIQLNLE
jgi:hypothetical protein